MKTPIDTLLDAVEFTPVPDMQPHGDTPYATHTGILKIADMEFEVFVLNDGRRIISSESMEKNMPGAIELARSLQ